MSTDPIPAAVRKMQHYDALVRISEAISACGEPEELAKKLADSLEEFLSFEHLDLLILKENSTEIESHVWGKGPLPLPNIPLEELPGWEAYERQEPLHVPEALKDTSFPLLKEAARGVGIEPDSIGAIVRIPLTTPHRRLGTFGVLSAPGVAYSVEDIGLLKLIGRVVAFAIDDGLNLRRAEEQNGRLELLLDLTTRITSNLELREVLRAVSSSIRTLMQCDVAAISLPMEGGAKFQLYAMDFPASKGHVKEEFVAVPNPRDPGFRAFETRLPVIANEEDMLHLDPDVVSLVQAEGFKTGCFIPLVNRDRAVGTLVVGRITPNPFTESEIHFLNRAGGQIAVAIENALAFQEISELKDKLAQEKLYLEEEIRTEMSFDQIVGTSAALKHVLQLVETVASSDSTVLLLGETGTGKELIARAIHDRSRRKDRTFVKLNCAAIPTGLLESELFGHEKGAFTGAISQKVGRMELADQGTLFLDEVGDIPIEIQPKLLRALQEREFERLGSTHTRKVNLRLIAATNRDLEKMIADREFRSDLFYRLNVFPIRIPPLRDRREDIPLLVSFFVQKFAKQMQKKVETIPSAMMKGLVAWDWPGNIRELENFIERAVILSRGKTLEAPLSELRKTPEPSVAAVAPIPNPDIAQIVKETISAMHGKRAFADEQAAKQRQEIIQVLKETKGQVGGEDGAAVRMGINRSTLISRMKKFGIDPHQYV